MAMCPLCNSFKTLEKYCAKCHDQLQDVGKVADFLDPYGHYNDIETVKMGDGYLDTIAENICPHMMYCNNCGYQEVAFIQEEDL